MAERFIRPYGRALLVGLALQALCPATATAVLDINDRGPRLDPGSFVLRVTNAAILGNAFYDVGLSSDPSFEYPANSGQEMLNYAALWVGARDIFGDTKVSGGPILEWRPTVAAEDRVRSAEHGRLGSRRLVDDDGDGRIDEELLNGKDDDGDHEVDEDLGFWSKKMLAADYVDDRPEAVNYIYEGGEVHRPLGLSVHQEVHGWATPGYDGIAGLDFHITNHGTETLHDLHVGLYADLDARLRRDASGHLNDRAEIVRFSGSVNEGTTSITGSNPQGFFCTKFWSETLPVVFDGGTGLPRVMVMPLDHTIDPLAGASFTAVAQAAARAPASVSFRSAVFSRVRPPGQGGVPTVDAHRYQALAGQLANAPVVGEDDYAVLVSCGPFKSLGPGQSIDFRAALIVATTPDSLAIAARNAFFVHRGVTANLVPDSTGEDPSAWFEGHTGLNGHEVCLEPPPGVTFYRDPHCPDKFIDENRPTDFPELYRAGHCIWTDADCDACTGRSGRETVLRWRDPGALPPAPILRTTPLDHGVRVEWDNLSEVLMAGGVAGPSGGRFTGYRVYRLSDWRERESLLPPNQNWSLLAAFGDDVAHGDRPLASVTDTSTRPVRVLFRRDLYAVGRYRFVDEKVLNGFDYAYMVAAVAAVGEGATTTYLETPLVTSFDRRVTPHASARSDARSVWVVPNPFRARAAWDRPAIGGDGLTRHIDFMGLPRARCTIRIWTLAGDLVEQIEHDGSAGDGQVAWNLVTRSGQDVESGVYLFTVDSSFGHQVGRFVIIR